MFSNGPLCQLSRNNTGKHYGETHASGALGSSWFLLLKAVVTHYCLFNDSVFQMSMFFVFFFFKEIGKSEATVQIVFMCAV